MNFSYVEMPAQNLRIRIVPDINVQAGLNGTNFDSTLSADKETWFVSFHQKYNSCKQIYILITIKKTILKKKLDKKTPEIIQNLKQFFMKDPNPMLLALKLFANCPGCNNLKNKNLALFSK